MEFMRSAMFVPGHRQRFIDKALAGLPCDVFMLDLEDGDLNLNLGPLGDLL